MLTDFTKLFEIISELCIENDIKNAICGELKSGEIKINKVKIGICLEKAFFRLNIVLNLFIFLFELFYNFDKVFLQNHIQMVNLNLHI